MNIIVGIGNPGRKYADTRHNVGFMAVEELAHRHRFGRWRRRFHSLAVEGSICGAKVLLMKPETYVNESGRAVGDAMRWCGVPLHDIMVVCDDFNLPLGRLRVRRTGSSGGHNGLKSIFDHLNSDEVPRLRIGTGVDGGVHDRDFVLSGFSSEERAVAETVVERAVGALEVWLESGVEQCMNEFNADPNRTPQDNEEEVDA